MGMTIARMIELLEIEHECMLRKSHDACDSHCGVCELVQDDGELHEMYIDVIALLKAQEMRIVTKHDFEDKTKVDSAGGLPVWIEYRREEEWGEYWENTDDEWAIVYAHNFESKSYRCWTSRPTDEQRKAEPWEKEK